MNLQTAIESAMQTITDLNDEWYELPELIEESLLGEVDVETEQSTNPLSGDCKDERRFQRQEGRQPVTYCVILADGEAVLTDALLKNKEGHIVDTVRRFIRNVYYSHSLLLKSAGVTSSSICPYDLNPAAVKAELRRIMDQCRRLRDDHRVFPSEMLKDKFLDTIALLSGAMLSIEQTRTKLLEVKEQAYSPVTDMHQPFSNLLLPTPKVYAMPAFLPDKLHGKHPWNNWLDNSAQPAPGWIAIQQKIPKAGEKLMRKIVLLYDAVQEQFDEDVNQDQSLEHDDGIPAPGDSFRHMTWSGFCTFPSYSLGFKSGKRKRYDFDGITTLEHFSRMLCMHYKGAGMEIGTDNCPFFRFAMAYRKLK
ncbi:hypothetical protein ONS95_001691 [Cadophora gregata]|uniref:uncharacterized protein n=1 Tax=Cadophora gregata TaxID=51156 RepID=UPI0026DB9B3C|nr:uncharacterized protein ONS95_001691 [Cadophora gregata]KAK0111326.1 hypothetical protein ONS95_001691 [Cadophora gregata]